VFREPGAGWIGFDTTATLGTDGRGGSELHTPELIIRGTTGAA